MPLFLRRGTYDTDLAANSTTIRQFDDAITRRAFGVWLQSHSVAISINQSVSLLSLQCQ